MLAVEEINAQGGVGGRPLSVVVVDDSGEPERAASGARELAQQGIRYIIGPFLTASGTAVRPVVNRYQVLTLSGTTMGQNLADSDDFYMSLIPTTHRYGQDMAPLALSAGHRRFVSISDSRNQPYCRTFLDALKAVLIQEAGASVVEVTYASRADLPYSRILERDEVVGADAVILCASPLDAALFSQKIRMLNSRSDLFSTSWALSRELIEYGGAAVEGMRFLSPVKLDDTSPGYLRFREKYTARFGKEPTYAAIFHYEAVMVLAAALEEDPDASSQVIKERILGRKVHGGVQYDFTLDPEGDVVRPLIEHRVIGGRFISVPSDHES